MLAHYRLHCALGQMPLEVYCREDGGGGECRLRHKSGCCEGHSILFT